MEDGGQKMEEYKFQKLRVYQMALDYVDSVYAVSELLPSRERFNLSSQIERAGTSIVLNIAEGSTDQSDAEQNRFLGLALRSYLETIACCDLIERRTYLDATALTSLREQGHQLFIKLSAFRKALRQRRGTNDRRPFPVLCPLGKGHGNMDAV